MQLTLSTLNLVAEYMDMDPVELTHDRDPEFTFQDMHHALVWDYSGRGMYGSQCVGVISDQAPMAFFTALVMAKAREFGHPTPTPEQVMAWTKAVGTPRSDSLGRRTIWYWPNLQAGQDLQDLHLALETQDQ